MANQYVRVKDVELQTTDSYGYGQRDCELVADVVLKLQERVFADTPLGADVRLEVVGGDVESCAAFFIDNDGDILKEFSDYEPNKANIKALIDAATAQFLRIKHTAN